MTNKKREDQARQDRRPWRVPVVSKFDAGSAEAAPFTPGSVDTGTVS